MAARGAPRPDPAFAKRNRRRRPAGGSGRLLAVLLHVGAAPRDKVQPEMSERKHGGDPSPCSGDRGVAHGDPYLVAGARRRPDPAKQAAPRARKGDKSERRGVAPTAARSIILPNARSVLLNWIAG
jgi:hypothetical protein